MLNHQEYTNTNHLESQTARSHNGTYRNNYDAHILIWCQLLLVRTIVHQNILGSNSKQCTICKEHARIDSSSAHCLNDYRSCFHKQYISAAHYFLQIVMSLLQKWPERLALQWSLRFVNKSKRVLGFLGLEKSGISKAECPVDCKAFRLSDLTIIVQIKVGWKECRLAVKHWTVAPRRQYVRGIRLPQN